MTEECCQENGAGYGCTLPKDHKGQHVAHGMDGEVFAQWWTCPECEGKRSIEVADSGSSTEASYVKCHVCNGLGEITDEEMDKWEEQNARG